MYSLVEKQSWAACAATYAAVVWAVKSLRGAAGPARESRCSGSVESHRLLLFLLASSFVWLCSSCTLQRQPQGGRWKVRGERELLLLSSLPSFPAVFLWLFVMPPLLHLPPKATAPWCTQIPLGWICLWCAYHKVCHHLRERGWLIVALQTEKKNKHIQTLICSHISEAIPHGFLVLAATAKSLLHLFHYFFCSAACEHCC